MLLFNVIEPMRQLTKKEKFQCVIAPLMGDLFTIEADRLIGTYVTLGLSAEGAYDVLQGGVERRLAGTVPGTGLAAELCVRCRVLTALQA